MTGAFQSWKYFLHHLNTISACNQISEHYNISQFQMWSMPSQIHVNDFKFKFKLPFQVLRTTFFQMKYVPVGSKPSHHLLTTQVYSDLHNTHSEHLIVA